MAKFYGVIGYAVTKETAPGVWTEEIAEQSYYGDLTRNMRRLQDSGDLNDDINVPLVHTCICKHQRWVVFDYHRC